MLTPLQLKKTNLIFVEHAKLKEENILLQNVVNLKDSTINILQESENLRFIQMSDLENLSKRQQVTINKLNDDLKKKTKAYNRAKNWAIGGCTISLGFILLLVL